MSSSPESDGSWREAMRQMGEAAKQAADAMALFALRCNRELTDWEDEMDNCYPNWPS